VHPFSVRIGPGDCRITTRFIPKDFSEAFFSTLHEVGHALYEQGLDPAHHGTPCGEPASYALHESQARLWENRVGRSRPFWKHFFPLARKVFHETLHAVQVDDFFRAVNHVEPGPDRVRADEATYDLHIIVRFELEQALLDGDLAPAELPGAWTEKYQKLLGVRPKSDVEGCLQDGHWGAGMIGYFPCYTLGNIIAAQLYARALEELPGLEEGFSRGDFSPLLHWLRSRIHRHGKCFPSDDLLRRIAGAPLDHRPLVRSLEEKYAEVYNL
jgi:carboxypeptidase Taq